mmetsp:Transcript_51045/g.131603  ORF Transcript_51045/g.131603 Transcript_51045/m.131603 type:complete len:225 (-) Transcript_51045:333-1007(-)
MHLHFDFLQLVLERRLALQQLMDLRLQVRQVQRRLLQLLHPTLMRSDLGRIPVRLVEGLRRRRRRGRGHLEGLRHCRRCRVLHHWVEAERRRRLIGLRGGVLVEVELRRRQKRLGHSRGQALVHLRAGHRAREVVEGGPHVLGRPMRHRRDNARPRQARRQGHPPHRWCGRGREGRPRRGPGCPATVGWCGRWRDRRDHRREGLHGREHGRPLNDAGRAHREWG